MTHLLAIETRQRRSAARDAIFAISIGLSTFITAIVAGASL